MKNNGLFKQLHVGKIIKDIAKQRQVSSSVLANVINRYHQNTDKIFRLEDMDVEDVVQISYALEHNILEVLSDDYLCHLPSVASKPEHENYSITLDLPSERFKIKKHAGNCDFLDDIHIGEHIRSLVEKIGWNAKRLAKMLNCAPNTISDLYAKKSLKLKKLFRIADALGHNLIAEAYISKMCIVSDFELFEQCQININTQKIRIINPKDKTLLMVFLRQDD